MLSRYKAFAALILSLSLTACASTPTKVADHVGLHHSLNLNKATKALM